MSSSCVEDAAAVGRERRGDRIVVALRRAPFCAGCDFLAAAFQVSRADLHGFTPPSQATSISESDGRNLHTTTCWSFAACRPRALRDTALMTDDATIKLNAKAYPTSFIATDQNQSSVIVVVQMDQLWTSILRD